MTRELKHEVEHVAPCQLSFKERKVKFCKVDAPKMSTHHKATRPQGESPKTSKTSHLMQILKMSLADSEAMALAVGSDDDSSEDVGTRPQPEDILKISMANREAIGIDESIRKDVVRPLQEGQTTDGLTTSSLMDMLKKSLADREVMALEEEEEKEEEGLNKSIREYREGLAPDSGPNKSGPPPSDSSNPPTTSTTSSSGSSEFRPPSPHIYLPQSPPPEEMEGINDMGKFGTGFFNSVQ